MAGKVPGAVVNINGEKLRRLIRQRWDGSRASLARACHTDPQTLSKLLSRTSCNAEMIRRIAPHLGMGYAELLDEVAAYNSVPHMHRLHSGFTLEQMSKKSGVSIETITNIEHGKDCFTFTAFVLAKTCNVTLSEYMGYEE